jgi:adenylate cyclase
MGVEIERKFLVIGGDWKSEETISISQGYLSTDIDRIVRVRISGNDAYLTIKGRSVGAVRTEYEYQIPLADGKELIKMCVGNILKKTRHIVVVGNSKWEVDVFHGENEGLVVAEIELTSEDEMFEKPEWIDEEVTNDARYFNSSLMQKPFKQW